MYNMYCVIVYNQASHNVLKIIENAHDFRYDVRVAPKIFFKKSDFYFLYNWDREIGVGGGKEKNNWYFHRQAVLYMQYGFLKICKFEPFNGWCKCTTDEVF